MNQPPSGDGDDDMERRFHTGLQDEGGPSETVRRAILEHARRVAIEHARSHSPGRTPILAARRRRTIFGALAAAVFAGLLVVPILRAPLVHKQSPVAARPNPHAALQSAQTPAPQLAEAERNDTSASAAGARRRISADADKPRKAAEPAASLADYTRQSKSAAPTSAAAAAAPPAVLAGARTAAPDVAPAIIGGAAPANRNLARAATSPGEQAESLRGAAAAGDLSAVNALLGSSLDVDARDRAGRTALMLAIVNGHAEVVAALLAHGAAVNAADTTGVRPLQIARAKGNEEIIDSLLRAGAH